MYSNRWLITNVMVWDELISSLYTSFRTIPTCLRLSLLFFQFPLLLPALFFFFFSFLFVFFFLLTNQNLDSSLQPISLVAPSAFNHKIHNNNNIITYKTKTLINYLHLRLSLKGYIKVLIILTSGKLFHCCF